MEVLKEFVVCLVTTIIFITAIELVGPDNEMKKYLKFVLGLILVAVILNPVIDFLTKGEGYLSKAVDSYTNKISGEIKENSKDTSKQNNDMRKKNFKENFDKNCESALNKKFEDYTFESDVECDADFVNMSIDVKSLKIYAKAKGIRKIEKIQIGKSNDQEDDEVKTLIKDFISEELKIDKNKVTVNYK